VLRDGCAARDAVVYGSVGWVDWFCFGEQVWAQCVQNGVAVWRGGCTVQGTVVCESEDGWTGRFW
jgi:hypothetical protein